MQVSDDQMGKRTRVIGAEPQLFTTDLKRSLDFYRSMLGFSVSFVYGTPPFYAGIHRDAARLSIRRARGPFFDAGFLAREDDPLSATIAVVDAAALFQEFLDRGVVVHRELKVEEWGAQNFIVRDPDDNLLLFAGPAPE